MLLNSDIEITSDAVEYEVSENFGGGTSLQGEIRTTYDVLRDLFGKPSYDTGDPNEKVQTEWCLEGKVFFTDEDGDQDYEYVKATVYNWKTGYTPIGEYNWHIGGHGYEAVELVTAILEGKVKPWYNLGD